MKISVIIFTLASFLVLNGCYTILTTSQEDVETEYTYSEKNENQNYYDEVYEEDIYSSEEYEYSSNEESRLIEYESETEINLGIIFSEVISGFFNSGFYNVVIDFSSDDSSSSEESTSKERENSSHRHTGSRNYDGR